MYVNLRSIRESNSVYLYIRDKKKCDYMMLLKDRADMCRKESVLEGQSMSFKDKSRYKTAEYKALQAEWSRNWYQRNKARVIANNVQRKRETRESGTISFGKGCVALIVAKRTRLSYTFIIAILPKKSSRLLLLCEMVRISKR